MNEEFKLVVGRIITEWQQRDEVALSPAHHASLTLLIMRIMDETSLLQRAGLVRQLEIVLQDVPLHPIQVGVIREMIVSLREAARDLFEKLERNGPILLRDVDAETS